MEIDDRIDELLWLVRCQHRAFLCFEDHEWCSDCQEWVKGIDVGDLSVIWQKDGNIVVQGGGYANRGVDINDKEKD